MTTRRRTAAAVDEEAELRALSERTQQSRSAVGETAGALAQAIAASAHLSPLVRKSAAHLTARIPRPWLAAVPVPVALATTVVAVYLLRRRTGPSPARDRANHARSDRRRRALPVIGTAAKGRLT